MLVPAESMDGGQTWSVKSPALLTLQANHSLVVVGQDRTRNVRQKEPVNVHVKLPSGHTSPLPSQVELNTFLWTEIP